MAEFSYLTTSPTLIVETSAGQLFAVRDTGDANLAHAWIGFAVKRRGAFFERKANARDILVRKAGSRVVDNS